MKPKIKIFKFGPDSRKNVTEVENTINNWIDSILDNIEIIHIKIINFEYVNSTMYIIIYKKQDVML